MDSLNWFEIIAALMITAKSIVALTPTPRDDIFLGKVYKAIEMLALSVGKAKDLPPNKKRND